MLSITVVIAIGIIVSNTVVLGAELTNFAQEVLVGCQVTPSRSDDRLYSSWWVSSSREGAQALL